MCVDDVLWMCIHGLVFDYMYISNQKNFVVVHSVNVQVHSCYLQTYTGFILRFLVNCPTLYGTTSLLRKECTVQR